MPHGIGHPEARLLKLTRVAQEKEPIAGLEFLVGSRIDHGHTFSFQSDDAGPGDGS